MGRINEKRVHLPKYREGEQERNKREEEGRTVYALSLLTLNRKLQFVYNTCRYTWREGSLG